MNIVEAVKTLKKGLSFLRSWEGRRYLFAKPYNIPLDIHIVWCRIKGHPNGVVFYRTYGDCPDTRCKDCGEEIG